MIREKLKYGSNLYKVYLYYHLYIKEKFYIKRSTYSQSKEDLFISHYFKNKKKGFYLDIGAYHPTKFSNTQLLYNMGWNGMNIDLNQVSIDCFKIVRKRDINIRAAISNKIVKKKIYGKFFFNPTNSLIANHYKKHNENFSRKNISYVKTERINNLISRKIDFLNIDIEGLDLKVMKDLNLKKLRPNLICVEMLNNKEKNEYIKYLKKFSYKLIKKIKSNIFFTKINK